MTKYVLTDYEINGYDDSDFMLTYWDDVTKKVDVHMHGTTRCGGCFCKLPMQSSVLASLVLIDLYHTKGECVRR